MSKTKKVQNVQALRGVAILAVMLSHLAVYELRFGHGVLKIGQWFHAGNAGVDLFFVISGFVMVITAAGKYSGPAGAGDFLWRRATRIYPLYWFYSLLVLPMYLRHPEMVNSSQAGVPLSLWKSFLLLPQQSDPLVAQGWTLVHEMYFYVVFALLLQLPRRLLGMALIAWAAIVTAGHLSLHHQTPTLALIVNPLTLEFILGCFVGLAIRQGINRAGPACLIVGAVGFGIAASLGVASDSPWARLLGYGIPSTLILYGAAASEARHALCLPQPLAFVGDISYSMYLSHGLVLAAAARIWWRFAPAGIASNLLGCLTLAVTTILVGYLSYRFIERVLQSLVRRSPFTSPAVDR